jgi:hypothetical protein
LVLECGCFAGFSSTCLSIACEHLGRDLVVADSFAGLPPPEAEHAAEYHAGQFAAPLDQWESNVRRFAGRVPRVTAGWFAASLRGWQDPIALLWLDVDLGSSVRDVLEHVTPHLATGALIFCHESQANYFDRGRITQHANPVWREMRITLERSGRSYRAYFLWGCLAEVELDVPLD